MVVVAVLVMMAVVVVAAAAVVVVMAVVVIMAVVVVAVAVAVGAAVVPPTCPLTGTISSDLLFLLWVTPTATATITPATTNEPPIMIASPLVVRYHGVDVDFITSFE